MHFLIALYKLKNRKSVSCLGRMIQNVALEFKLKRIKVDDQNIVLRHSFIWGSENGSIIALRNCPLHGTVYRNTVHEVPLFGDPEKVAETNL